MVQSAYGIEQNATNKRIIMKASLYDIAKEANKLRWNLSVVCSVIRFIALFFCSMQQVI